jgi:hypothetical protein
VIVAPGRKVRLLRLSVASVWISVESPNAPMLPEIEPPRIEADAGASPIPTWNEPPTFTIRSRIVEDELAGEDGSTNP